MFDIYIMYIANSGLVSMTRTDNNSATTKISPLDLGVLFRRLGIHSRQIRMIEKELKTIQETQIRVHQDRIAELEDKVEALEVVVKFFRSRETPVQSARPYGGGRPIRVGDLVKVVDNQKTRSGQIGRVQRVTGKQYKVCNELGQETFQIYKASVRRHQI